jgi:hypothetical protein
MSLYNVGHLLLRVPWKFGEIWILEQEVFQKIKTFEQAGWACERLRPSIPSCAHILRMEEDGPVVHIRIPIEDVARWVLLTNLLNEVLVGRPGQPHTAIYHIVDTNQI